jgi:hypothetical protein
MSIRSASRSCRGWSCTYPALSGPEGGIPHDMRCRTSTISDSLAFTPMCTRPSRRFLVCDVSSIYSVMRRVKLLSRGVSQICIRAEPQPHHVCPEYQVGSTQVFDTLTRQDIRSNRRDNAYRLIFFICERSKPHGSQELRWSSCGDHRRG